MTNMNRIIYLFSLIFFFGCEEKSTNLKIYADQYLLIIRNWKTTKIDENIVREELGEWNLVFRLQKIIKMMSQYWFWAFLIKEMIAMIDTA